MKGDKAITNEQLRKAAQYLALYADSLTNTIRGIEKAGDSMHEGIRLERDELQSLSRAIYADLRVRKFSMKKKNQTFLVDKTAAEIFKALGNGTRL